MKQIKKQKDKPYKTRAKLFALYSVERRNIMAKNYESLANLKPELIGRGGLGSQELEWLYGYTKFPNYATSWGCPRYTVSLWSGASGTGKSRLAIAVAKCLATAANAKILYFQNEVDLQTFSGWVKDRTNCKNFYCSTETSVIEQLKIIKEIKPSMVFVDSVNELNEYGSGAKGNVKTIMKYYRHAVLQKYCDCIILLAQLNQDGTIKGSTTLPHLVDIAFDLKPIADDGGKFIVSVGVKHRYGRKGDLFTSTWQHFEDGVKCITENRLSDKIWCDSHNIPVKSQEDILIEDYVPEDYIPTRQLTPEEQSQVDQGVKYLEDYVAGKNVGNFHLKKDGRTLKNLFFGK